MKRQEWLQKRTAVSKSDAKSVHADNIISYIDQNFAEKLTVSDVAAALYLNKEYMMRMFKQCKGVTVMDYLHKKRCDEAARLLSGTSTSIEIIAYSVGYVTASHFAKKFRELYGITPSEYRNRTRDRKKSDE